MGQGEARPCKACVLKVTSIANPTQTSGKDPSFTARGSDVPLVRIPPILVGTIAVLTAPKMQMPNNGWGFLFVIFCVFCIFLVLGLQEGRKQGRKQQPGRIGRKEGGREGGKEGRKYGGRARRKEGTTFLFTSVCAGNTGSNGIFC